jgi:hypothetical protein
MMRYVHATLLIVAFMSGCSSKPPECASPEALAVVQSLFVDEVASATRQLSMEAIDPAADVPAEGAAYSKALKVRIENIVKNGYDGDAHKFTCSGKLAISTPTGHEFSRNTDYSIQATADGKGNFVVKVSDSLPFLSSLEKDFSELLVDKFIARRSGQPLASAAGSNQCVEAKMAAARRELDEKLDQAFKEAEKDGSTFKGLSPVQEEEWQQKSLQKAKAECP